MKWGKVSIKAGGSQKTRRWESCVYRPSKISDTLPISELLPSGGQIGGPGRTTKPCVLPHAWERMQERSKGGCQVVSCSGVFLAPLEDYL